MSRSFSIPDLGHRWVCNWTVGFAVEGSDLPSPKLPAFAWYIKFFCDGICLPPGFTLGGQKATKTLHCMNTSRCSPTPPQWPLRKRLPANDWGKGYEEDEQVHYSKQRSPSCIPPQNREAEGHRSLNMLCRGKVETGQRGNGWTSG